MPMAVEEPSIVAAISAAAQAGPGVRRLRAELTPPDPDRPDPGPRLPDMPSARAGPAEHKQEILDLANSFHPNMVARGGGAVDVEVHSSTRCARAATMLVVHLLVDTRDAMGANLVNGMCEGVASAHRATHGRRRCSCASCRTWPTGRWPRPKDPAGRAAGRQGLCRRAGAGRHHHRRGFRPRRPLPGGDPQQGVMNGVDAVALATGNDWRAIEAGAHAYAARAAATAR